MFPWSYTHSDVGNKFKYLTTFNFIELLILKESFLLENSFHVVICICA